MLKKVRRVFVATIAFVMLFSMTAFAAETSTSNENNLTMEAIESNTNTEGAVARAYAPVVTSVSIDWEKCGFDDDGNVIIAVYIVGYGYNEICRWDGVDATYLREEYIVGADRVVYAFRQYWNCGPAETGTHTFTFSTISRNDPKKIVHYTEQVWIEE